MIQNGESLGRPRQAFCRGSIGRCPVVTGTGATSRLINENRGRQAARITGWKRERSVPKRAIARDYHEGGNSVQRNHRSGDGGAPGGPTRPQSQTHAWDGSWHVPFGPARPISRRRHGTVQYCRPFQTATYCTGAAGRRSTRDGKMESLPSTPRMQCRLPALRH